MVYCYGNAVWCPSGVSMVCYIGDSYSCCFWLVWRVTYSSLKRCKNISVVTWSWTIYLEPKWPLWRKSPLCFVCGFVKKPFEISNDFNGQLWCDLLTHLNVWSTAIGKVVKGFPMQPKLAQQVDPFNHLWVKNMNKWLQIGFSSFKWLIESGEQWNFCCRDCALPSNAPTLVVVWVRWTCW